MRQNKLLAAAFALIVILLGILFIMDFESIKNRISTDKDVPCVAGFNEACPNVDLLEADKEVQKLQAELNTSDIRQKVALLRGYEGIVQANIPSGWSYDRQKKKLLAPTNQGANPIDKSHAVPPKK